MVAAGMWLMPHEQRIPEAKHAQVSAQPMAAPHTAERDRVPRVALVRRLQRHPPRRAAGRREMARTVSYPAPPAPLTMQEKLLVQVAEHPTPGEIAMLDPVVREKQETAEDAQFAKFVAQADPQ
jgi:hypothetical protein